ncbi:MAG: ABC transporter ATP-binding protein [Candidatus Poribacteria bacterium]|nr:ABC transporter ATP-binding protein [Candidatus Poribacteria bacterium]MDE0506877.1 ABC transporter ATP-binding protein [Candidatus Poribacteria bacterium]
MASIELRNITKRFGDIIAVNNLSLEIQDGEFLVFLGPSGCGKTTTLRLIAGLEHPEVGDILIDGVRTNHLSPADRDIAFVFQFYALYPHLTVFDNLAFPLKAVRIDQSEISGLVQEVARLLQIDRLLDRKPSHLSGGEMQRVALGRAMVRRPKAFLMDEPMANLDAKLRVDMRSELKRLQYELGTTTVFVTHDQVEAMSMADRIAVMHRGVLEQVATPHEVYNKPQSMFVAGFMGSPSMNLLHGCVQSDGGKTLLRLDHTNVSWELSDEQVSNLGSGHREHALVFGIRPEHIRISKEPVNGGIKAAVHLVESIGSVNIIDIFLGEDPETTNLITLRVRTHPSFQVESGQFIYLEFDEKHIHFFDSKTERII